MGRTFNFVADSMNGREKNLPPSGTEFGLYMMAARASCGTISFNISRYFPAMLACRTVKPVMLRPGRAMLALHELITTLGEYRDLDDSECLTLPPEAYVSPGLYQLEIERIFRREWLC